MTSNIKSAKPRRRMAREPQASAAVSDASKAQSPGHVRKPSKLDIVEAMLVRKDGASIAEIMAATDWQQHSVRGAMAGALRKRGLIVTSEKVDGLRRYSASKQV